MTGKHRAPEPTAGPQTTRTNFKTPTARKPDLWNCSETSGTDSTPWSLMAMFRRK